MKLLSIILFNILFLSNTLLADAGDKKVKLTGKTNPTAPKYITPKYLEKNFTLFKKHLYNPWEKRADTYEGVFLDEILTTYGTQDVNSLNLIALDDYSIEFSKKFLNSEKILLVTKVNGNYISVREKGPLRVVFVNYDPSSKKYEDNLYKWLWMVKKIKFQ